MDEEEGPRGGGETHRGRERAPGCDHLGINNTVRPHGWWPLVRTVLEALEAGFVLTQHDALAAGTRAVVITGNLAFGPRS
ncbi:hypothetical protein ABT160_13880 [Streptomyces sp. NPDC001941]|uniref:hypothetical protein n=1 Tax=Streptomyces sp. NPDC001941 TaxID=3154659 RepID=UPI00331EA6B7